MRKIYKQANAALVRFHNTSAEDRILIEEQILDTVDSHLYNAGDEKDEVISEWMSVFAEEHDSEVFQGLYDRKFNS